ncbi:MAG: hypothetical protein C0627_03830 [Sulfurimonas sp.]|nr:MAG: hypothetical protein C0627_03830 [Sulfurimonas sp.]
MAKENWSARIEVKFKKDLQEFMKDSNYTNEDIVIQGYETLKHLQNNHAGVASTVAPSNQEVFTSEAFDINLFEEMNISNFSRSDLQYKLSRISFWKPYNTLLKMNNGRYLFVKSVDNSIDEIIFGVIGEALESVISLQRIINEVENISQIFELKVR